MAAVPFLRPAQLLGQYMGADQGQAGALAGQR